MLGEVFLNQLSIYILDSEWNKKLMMSFYSDEIYWFYNVINLIFYFLCLRV